jgi:hypothetical protein
MILKPNYPQAFAKTFLRYFLYVALVSIVWPYLQGKGIRIDDVLPVSVLGGLVFGVFVTGFLTPREISWDEETFSIRTVFPASGDFNWAQLEAWTPYGSNMSFRIKFKDTQTFAIAPTGFRSEDWDAFMAMLQQRFGDKKSLVWIGLRPARFGKK